VLILRAGRAEAFGSPTDVLHRLVRSPAGAGGAGGDKPEQPRRIESSGP
jgi:ATP-binding cassette subfamily C protein